MTDYSNKAAAADKPGSHAQPSRCKRGAPSLAALLTIGAAMLIAACHTPPKQAGKDMTLGEAQAVSLSFQRTQFTPPPRTTEDIPALLRRFAVPGPSGPMRLPNEIRRGLKASENYMASGGTAAYNGQYPEHVEYFRRAAIAAEGTEMEYFRLVDYSYAQMFTQGLPQALETRQRALKVAQRYRYDAMMGAAHLILSFGYAYVGDTPTARQHVQRALPLYRRARLQDPYGARWWSDAWEADVAFYQGVLLEAEGRVPEALTLFEAAVSAQERNIQVNKERLRSKLPAHPQDHVEIWLAMMQTYYAEALAKDGQFAAAEQEMRKALIRALRIGNDRSPLTATLLTRFAAIVHDQGRYKDALELSQAAMDRFSRGRAEEASTPYLDARRAYASALAASGSWQEAMAAFDRMEEGFASDLQLSERLWLGDIYWGLALLQTGQAGKAANMLQMHVNRSAERLGPKHYRTAEAQAVLGAAFAGAGSTQQALENFTAAIPVLVSEASQRNLLPAEQARLRQIVEAYIDLLYDLRDSELLRRASLDAREESFQVAELARIGSLQRSVMASVARASASDGGLAELVRQEQDSAQLTQALEKALMAQLAAPASYQSGPQIDALRQQLEQARTAQARLRAELTDRHPRYAQMLKPKPPSSAAVARVMAEGEALVAVFVGTRTTYVWSVNRQGSLHFARAGLGSEALRGSVKTLRLSLDPNVASLQSIPEFDVNAAHRLYEALLVPVREGWEGKRSLIIVPHEDLSQLPFSLLSSAPYRAPATPEKPLFERYRNVGWLVRQYAVTHFPSTSALVAQRDLKSEIRTVRTFGGIGNPVFSAGQAEFASSRAEGEVADDEGAPVGLLRNLRVERVAATDPLSGERSQVRNSSRLAQVPPLPETADEVKEIAAVLGASESEDVFLGLRASESTVKSGTLAGRRFLVFATHGLVAGELDGLDQPALALSSPEATGERGEDGLLRMSEILGLKLDAQLVVLSACNTAAGDGAGAEAVSGLGRSFFYAGARSLLVTHWPVETTSAKALTTEVFKRLQQAETSTGEALRQAMNVLIDEKGYADAGKKGYLFSYAHPIFWAPFALMGEGSEAWKD